MLKIAAFEPMATASVVTTAAVNVGAFVSERHATRRSVHAPANSGSRSRARAAAIRENRTTRGCFHSHARRESGLDAYRWLRQFGFRGEVVFLTGHAAHHPLVEQARALGKAKVLAQRDQSVTIKLAGAAPAVKTAPKVRMCEVEAVDGLKVLRPCP